MSLHIPPVSSFSLASPPSPIRYFDLLPPELLLLVVEYAAGEYSRDFLLSKERQATLCSLCLTSKALKSIAQPILFADVAFDEGDRWKLLSLIKNNDSVMLASIKRLLISFGGPLQFEKAEEAEEAENAKAAEILAINSTHLQELACTGQGTNLTKFVGTNIVTLSIWHLELENFSFPHLKYLSIITCGLADSESRFDLPSLQHLSYASSMSHSSPLHIPDIPLLDRLSRSPLCSVTVSLATQFDAIINRIASSASICYKAPLKTSSDYTSISDSVRTLQLWSASDSRWRNIDYDRWIKLIEGATNLSILILSPLPESLTGSKDLGRLDHLSLFLVSKKIRSYAQSTIRLHSELVITWSGHVGSRLDGGSAFIDEQARNWFFRVVKRDPHLLSYLTSLSLLIDPSTCNETTRVGQATIRLLSGAVRLSNLKLTRPHVTGSGSLSFAILDAIPFSVTRLELGGSPIGQMGLEHLLISHSLIGTLDLTRTGIIEFEKEEEGLRFPSSLKVLEFPKHDYSWHPFLQSFLNAAEALTVYSGCLFSARYLLSLDLSCLTSLTLSSPDLMPFRPHTYNFGSRPRSMAETTSTLAALLDKAPELLKLDVNLAFFCDFFDHTIPPVSILTHLSPKVQRLSVKGSHFFTNRDLLRYLASPTRSPRLSILCLPIKEGEEKDENVLDLCRDRGIKVTFYGWRP
ncbi:hypothetical protein JCM5350_007298 [Sporobolomyces pararoseus]